MNRFAGLVHFFWPWLEKLSPEQAIEVEERRKSDETRIAALNLARAPTVALDEIRRLADSEAERRRGTEQKAATYLPLVAALIPLVLTMVSALWEKKAGSAPIWANMLLLGLAVAYMAAAGWWAFRVLKVAMSYEPGLGDFERCLKEAHPTAALAGQLLRHTRRNQEGINRKVSCIKMAHEFLLRAFLAFSALLALNIGWYLVGLLLQMLAPHGPELETAEQALAAVARVEKLADRLQTAPAWVALDEACRGRVQHPSAVKLIAGATSVAATAPASLKPRKDEAVITREIRVVCDGKTVGRVRAWYLLHRLPGKPAAAALPLPLAAADILSVTKAWPPKTSSQDTDAVPLPAALLRQVAQVQGMEGEAAAVVVTIVGPGLIVSQ